VGCDEAGRGCLAGPVFAAAVMLDPDHPIEGLNDSKKLSEGSRNVLRQVIEEKAICYAVRYSDPILIDRINILQASLKAMFDAVIALVQKPSLVLVDGRIAIPSLPFPQQCIIKGDALFQSIAAASILAKTYRDEFMQSLHVEYPFYHWHRNKGYGTPQHLLAIDEYGLSKHHRKSFQIKNHNGILFDELS